MSRKPRELTVVPGEIHHVIVRGNNRRNIFTSAADRLAYSRYLSKALLQYGCRCHALSLMKNHIHNAIVPPSVDALSKCMQSVNGRYAMFRNRNRDGSGKLFEERFIAKPVLDEDYLRTVILYIDDNARAAGAGPRHRRWSTEWFHLGEPERSDIPSGLWTPSAWYLGLGHNSEERAAQYREWLMAYRENRNMFAEIDEIWSAPATGVRLERPNRRSAK